MSGLRRRLDGNGERGRLVSTTTFKQVIRHSLKLGKHRPELFRPLRTGEEAVMEIKKSPSARGLAASDRR